MLDLSPFQNNAITNQLTIGHSVVKTFIFSDPVVSAHMIMQISKKMYRVHAFGRQDCYNT